MKILKSHQFNIPIISIGNISAGGTGKSPHIEYLIRLLKNQLKIATISRGYKRETKGYLKAQEGMSFKQIGDEPLQFFKKYPEVKVLVSENRVDGVSRCIKEEPDVQLILLDDAYQHRRIAPGLNILLIDYATIGKVQFMLPSGVLREWRRGRKRADAIVISKSPEVFSPIEARRIEAIVRPEPHQKIFYSYIDYLTLKSFNTKAEEILQTDSSFALSEYKVLLFSGIASSLGLRNYLTRISKEVVVSEFKDHHAFTISDLLKIQQEFHRIVYSKKIIITTEKDTMRLMEERFFPILSDVPVFYLPIEVKFHNNQESFDQFILNYVRSN